MRCIIDVRIFEKSSGRDHRSAGHEGIRGRKNDWVFPGEHRFLKRINPFLDIIIAFHLIHFYH
jgi:hypothetical protein